MGLKAGWIALFIFVWAIGAFLGSTFDYQSAQGATGISYSEGNATFTAGSSVTTHGGLGAWTVAMQGGNISLTADGIPCKIKHVGGGVLSNGSGVATGSPLTLALGANVIPVTRLGTLTVVLPAGNTGQALTGTCTVVPSPTNLVAGTNTIAVTAGAVPGTINVNFIAPNTVIFLYSAYTGTGGAGAYIIQTTPGWAGTGTGGYTKSPLNTLEDLMFANQVQQRNALIGAVTLIVNPKFWEATFDILLWRWSFMMNPDGTLAYGMFYWIFLFPFVAMGFLSVLLLVYGILTGNISFG